MQQVEILSTKGSNFGGPFGFLGKGAFILTVQLHYYKTQCVLMSGYFIGA